MKQADRGRQAVLELAAEFEQGAIFEYSLTENSVNKDTTSIAAQLLRSTVPVPGSGSTDTTVVPMMLTETADGPQIPAHLVRQWAGPSNFRVDQEVPNPLNHVAR